MSKYDVMGRGKVTTLEQHIAELNLGDLRVSTKKQNFRVFTKEKKIQSEEGM